jgi:hypothetical protein
MLVVLSFAQNAAYFLQALAGALPAFYRPSVYICQTQVNVCALTLAKAASMADALPAGVSPTLPLRPSTRWSPKLDEVRICTQCGREIIVRRCNVRGEVVREFLSLDGCCLNCARLSIIVT